MNPIIFKEHIAYRSYDYANRLYPKVLFANYLMEDEKVVEFSMDYVAQLFERRKKLLKKNDCIFSEQVINSFISDAPWKEAADHNVENVSFWLSYCMGEYCATLPLDDIWSFLEHMLYSTDGEGLVYSYVPKEKELTEKAKTINFSPENLLYRSRMSNESVKEYIDYYSNLPQEKILEAVNSPAFSMQSELLPWDCEMILSMLVRCKLYEKCIEILLGIHIPKLIVACCEMFHCASDSLSLYEQLKGNNTHAAETLRIILRNKWLMSLSWQNEYSFAEIPSNAGNEDVTKAYKAFIADIPCEIKKQEETAFSLFKEVEGVNTIARWISSLKTDKDRGVIAIMARNAVFRSMKELLDSHTSSTDYVIADDSSLNYLSLLAEKFAKEAVEVSKKKDLFQKLLKCIESERFHWIPQLEESNMEQMRSFARLIADLHLSDQEFLKTIHRFEVRYEGFGADAMNTWHDKSLRYAYLLSVLLLMAEICDEDNEHARVQFRLATSSLLKVCYCCSMDLDLEHNYQIPLILAELIACQVLRERLL